MSITLYTAPNCIRCKIVKEFLAERGMGYEGIDFKADATAFNTFYRARRKDIYRNPEGVEFPLFDDGTVLKQGSGEILAYLLSGRVLEAAVTRSDLLHGWISGLYLSQCPAGQEDNFATLVTKLAQGGLEVCVQTDGRRPDLLERLIREGHMTKIQLNILGPASVYEAIMGNAPGKDELGKTIELVRAFPNHEIRLLVSPVPRGPNTAEGTTWLTRNEAAEAALMVFEACNDHQLPYSIAAVTAEMPQGMAGLDPVPDPMFLKYRSASRDHLFMADVAKI